MSILDYENKTLCSEIWDKNDNLRFGVKSFIYNSIEMFFIKEGIKDDTHFIKDILLASSLATYYYTKTSDLDVKIIIDTDSFKKSNPLYSEKSSDEALEILIDKGREGSWLTAAIPGTAHVLDVYFIDITEFIENKYIKYDSLYSITKSKWLKFPQKIDTHGNPSYILDRAKEKAKDYLDQISMDLSTAKRDTMDYYILMDYLKTLDKDDIKIFYKEIEKSVSEINNSVEQLLQDREMLKVLRKTTFNKQELDSQLSELMNSLNYDDGNLIFKVIQRYGYMRILTNLKKMFNNEEITVDKIDTVNKILNDEF